MPKRGTVDLLPLRERFTIRIHAIRSGVDVWTTMEVRAAEACDLAGNAGGGWICRLQIGDRA